MTDIESMVISSEESPSSGLLSLFPRVPRQLWQVQSHVARQGVLYGSSRGLRRQRQLRDLPLQLARGHAIHHQYILLTLPDALVPRLCEYRFYVNTIMNGNGYLCSFTLTSMNKSMKITPEVISFGLLNDKGYNLIELKK